jgi:SAM-dependent methyltransferase
MAVEYVKNYLLFYIFTKVNEVCIYLTFGFWGIVRVCKIEFKEPVKIMEKNQALSTPLYSLNPLNRFSSRAEDYAKYRPSYPAQAIDTILAGLAPVSELLVADVGAGTGISSHLIAERGVSVIATEPNKEMREAIQEHGKIRVCDATAENTSLPDASVDLVTCFQAFHWFNPELALIEFHRILKPKGRLALVWNNRDTTNELVNEYSHLVQTVSENHPAESRMESVEPLFRSQLFTNIRESNFIYQQELDLNGFIGRAMSVSYLPREGEKHEQLITGLRNIYQKYSNERGLIYMSYRTSVYFGEAV